jgi:hypothetical protein
MQCITSTAKISWARSIHNTPFHLSLAEWISLLFLALLSNLLRSPVLVVTLTKIDTGISKSLEGKW